MELRRWTKLDPRLQKRLRVIVRLGRQRDRLLESPALDLAALAQLVQAYEQADLPCAAAALRRRLKWYRSKRW